MSADAAGQSSDSEAMLKGENWVCVTPKKDLEARAKRRLLFGREDRVAPWKEGDTMKIDVTDDQGKTVYQFDCG